MLAKIIQKFVMISMQSSFFIRMCIEYPVSVKLFVIVISSAVNWDFCRRNIDKNGEREYTIIVTAVNTVYCRTNNQIEVQE